MSAPAPSYSKAQIKTLIVDDDPSMTRSIQRILRESTQEVEIASDGEEALEMLKGKAYDVVISDIAMPKMDGFTLLQRLHSYDPLLPVVLLTGTPTVSSAVKALEAGAFRYVTKPYNPRDLVDVIEKAARMHRMAVVKDEAARIVGQQFAEQDEMSHLNDNFERALDGLWMAFQPIVDPHTQTIYGYEALMRSQEPSLPHPGAVLDAAERLGQLEYLGRQVRQLAAQALPTAQPDLCFFINLHVRDLLDPLLVSPESPLAPFARQIVLEVTERASLDEVPDAAQRINKLRELGYRIAVDDLGAGYAGLTSFALLEPEFVKLDMSLVRDIHLSPVKRKVVSSMINLANDMGMKVVGEGVETPEESKVLCDLGCNLLQGYYYARPERPFVEVTWS
jgi:EAL domain-containing protein (putative c-di-GMP-specific phosphodiesterase class I)